MDGSDQPNSICHVQTIQMYQLPPPIAESGAPAAAQLQCFKLLTGEAIFCHGTTVDGLIILTNFRLYLQIGDNHHHVPLGLIEAVEHRDLFYLHVGCKDARTFRVVFATNESCLDWFDHITKASEPTKQLEQIFAFYYYIWTKNQPDAVAAPPPSATFDSRLFRAEMDRLHFSGDSWRISDANKAYKLCPTYPPYLIVPSCINDDMLECVAKFRSSRRIPAVVWRHARNGAVVARCSQPEVGWLGWRSSEDEDLIKAISQACHFDQYHDNKAWNLRSDTSDKDTHLSHSPDDRPPPKERKVLIMDARSYTTAVANRARGGGCECPEYYPNCEIQFMNLANIHSIRKSFHALRLLCAGTADQPTWFGQLEGTKWLGHMSGLLKAAVTLVSAVERDARPVLVHCSDGWDRTPQIIALAELLLDPHYRTLDGFRILIEREWLAFGHKFADRCGHSTGADDQNERCPVFLQWLDCVHQLVTQFPCAFEFSQTYLVKLAQHVYSNLYGTFLANTFEERARVVFGKTFSVWNFLNSSQFHNYLYCPSNEGVLWPQCNVRDLRLWNEVYLGSWEANFGSFDVVGCVAPSCNGLENSQPSLMVKTRSYGDLKNANGNLMTYCTNRRSSDPSINNIDKKLNGDDGITNNKSAFLCNGGSSDCSNDCIYKNGYSLTNGEEIECFDGCLRNGFGSNRVDNVIDCNNGCKTDLIIDEVEVEVEKVEVVPSNSQDDSPSVKSEVTICDYLHGERSIETSTDTLISEQLNSNCDQSSPTSNGFEKVDQIDGCKVCAQNFRFVNDSNSTGRRLNSPNFSRTSSTSGWDNGLPGNRGFNFTQHGCNLGEDGLVPVQSVAQERLLQIIEEHKRRVELLEKELHTYRQALINQFCHKCSNTDCEKVDETGSVVESIGSVGEGHTSAVESLRSDLSWEALEENAILTECTATLWVPDHAVSRCTGCQTEFWVGKRKHHCRKCGRIFCASCSENSTPLPSEQLYEPVRVCTGCYSKLSRDVGPLTEQQCKHHNGHQTTTTTQITASSN